MLRRKNCIYVQMWEAAFSCSVRGLNTTGIILFINCTVHFFVSSFHSPLYILFRWISMVLLIKETYIQFQKNNKLSLQRRTNNPIIPKFKSLTSSFIINLWLKRYTFLNEVRVTFVLKDEKQLSIILSHELIEKKKKLNTR